MIIELLDDSFDICLRMRYCMYFYILLHILSRYRRHGAILLFEQKSPDSLPEVEKHLRLPMLQQRLGHQNGTQLLDFGNHCQRARRLRYLHILLV